MDRATPDEWKSRRRHRRPAGQPSLRPLGKRPLAIGSGRSGRRHHLALEAVHFSSRNRSGLGRRTIACRPADHPKAAAVVIFALIRATNECAIRTAWQWRPLCQLPIELRDGHPKRRPGEIRIWRVLALCELADGLRWSRSWRCLARLLAARCRSVVCLPSSAGLPI